MKTTPMIDVLDDLLDPLSDCLTPDLAQKIVALHASPRVEMRIDDLAAKAREGSLTDSERAEYETCIDAIDLISILQAKASEAVSRAG